MSEKQISTAMEIVIPINTSKKYIKQLIDIDGFNQSIYLSGPSGIGKSEIVYQLAEELNAELFDIRLGSLDVIDLNGIGVPDIKNKTAFWTRPENFPPEKSDKLFILFLDEFNHANESVLGSAYQIVLERRMGTHKFPPNMLIIAAGNTINDNGIAFSLPSPLINRFTKMNVKEDIDEWLDFAIQKNIDWKITGFLKSNPKYLHRFIPESTEDNFCTPRNWVKSNKIVSMENIDDNIDFVKTVLNGMLGYSAMLKFTVYLDLIKKLPMLEDVLNDNNPEKLDNELDSSYAFFMLIKNYLINNIEKEISNEQLFNIIKFVNKQSNQEVMQLIIFDILEIVNSSNRLNNTINGKKQLNEFHYLLFEDENNILNNNISFKNKMKEFSSNLK
jgi:hypothetical protein